MFTSKANIDLLRTVAFGSITGSFTPVGAPQMYPARIICFTNTTNANVIFSNNGTTDQVFVPAGGFKLFDVTTNHRPVNQDDFGFSTNTQWYVRNLATTTSGSVYIEIIYAEPS